MANFTIEQLRSLPDFAKQYRWDIQFLTLPVVGPLGFPLSEEMNLRCESTGLPNTSTEVVDIEIRGHKVRQPGVTSYSDSITLTFNETLDNAVHLFFKAWRESIWETRTGRSFDKRHITSTLKITRLDNNDNPVWDYVLYGCFPSQYEFGELGNASEVIKPVLTLAYDYFVDSPAV